MKWNGIASGSVANGIASGSVANGIASGSVGVGVIILYSRWHNTHKNRPQ
jgi:hypothetical protein